MTASLRPEAYRFDSTELHKAIIKNSIVRTIAYNNIRGDLNYDTDDKYRFYQLKDDTNPQVSFGNNIIRRADFAEEYVDKNVPVIAEGLSYSRKDLAKVEKGLFSLDDRVMRIIRQMGRTEERFLFAGDPAVPTGMGDFHLTHASNQTAATTNFDTQTVATMRTSLGGQIGQLIDEYGSELVNYPIFMVVSPDVYKEIIGVSNANTDSSALNLLNEDLKTYGLDTGFRTHVFVSDYLFGQAGALDFDGPDVVLGTTGTEAEMLIVGDPDAWRLELSPVFQGFWEGTKGAIDVELGFAFLPYFFDDRAVIYDNNVELAAQ